jgi:drug/metabolite transporter (DMT)-like permease
LGVVIVALFLVGLSGVLRPSSDNQSASTFGETIAGVLLVVLGSAFNSFQNVYEEKLLKAISYAEVDSLEVVGWEGLFGSLISMFIMLPIVGSVNGSLREDTIDTIAMFHNSWKPAVFFAVGFALSLTALNYYSQQLSKYISAVVRMLVSTVRVVLVWVISLIIYYQIDSTLGEKWDDSSYLQLGGFVLLVIGTLMYVNARDIPLEKDDDFAEADNLEDAKVVNSKPAVLSM